MGCLPKYAPSTLFYPVPFWITGIILFSYAMGENLKGINFVDVSCNYSNFSAVITFHDVFKGVIFPEGRFFYPDCKFPAPVIGTKNMSFVLPLTDCGNLIREVNGNAYILNNIVVQKHPIVQTDSDVVYKTSCKLPQINMMQSFIHESHPTLAWNKELEAYMEFQSEGETLGYGVSNKLLVGDEFRIVIHVKDGGMHKDFLVEKCWAYEGETSSTSRFVLKIHDMFNCKNEWITGFSSSKGVENESNSVIYGTIKAFKFPISQNLHITCSVQACTEICYRQCDPETERSNSNRYKRSLSSNSDKGLQERYRLMKATVKALGTRLMERNRKLSEEIVDINFNRRSSKSEVTAMVTESKFEASTEILHNEIYSFNVTNNVVVYAGEEFNIQQEQCNNSRILKSDCIPSLRFSIITASLSFTIFCLLLVCVGLMLHVRKEKKKNHIDGFLLYNLF